VEREKESFCADANSIKVCLFIFLIFTHLHTKFFNLHVCVQCSMYVACVCMHASNVFHGVFSSAEEALWLQFVLAQPQEKIIPLLRVRQGWLRDRLALPSQVCFLLCMYVYVCVY